MQKLVQLRRVDAFYGLFPVDQALGNHVDGDLQRRLGGSLAGPGLQHPQLAALDGELHVLHVGVMLLKLAAHLYQVGIDFRQRALQGRKVRSGGRFSRLGQRLRGTDSGNHVFPLGVEQEFPIEAVVAVGRVAGEADAGGAVVPHVAENHGLNVDRRAPIDGNAVQAPVSDGAFVHPRAENGADGPPKLIRGVLGKGLAGHVLGLDQIVLDQGLEVIGLKIGVQVGPPVGLQVFQQVLEVVVINAHHHIAVHLDETAVAVVGEPFVAAVRGQSFDAIVIEAEVEDGIHHPRHRGARTGAHGNQKRFFGAAEPAPQRLFDLFQRPFDALLKPLGIGVGVFGVMGADLGGDGETGRHRQAQTAHFRQVRPLAAQKLAHVGGAFGRAVAEFVNPLAHRSPPSIFEKSAT